MTTPNNYVIDSNHNIINEYKNKLKLEAIADIEYFKSINIEDTDDISIFINISMQSNGYINFINDCSKYIDKTITLYFHKKNSIERIFKIFIKDNIIEKLKNIIFNIDFEYYTPMKIYIEKYIEENQIKNYIIYY
jgi:sugar-specific transcriptional regulator TrmB